MRTNIVVLLLIVGLSGCAHHIDLKNKLHEHGFGDALIGMTAEEISGALKSEVTEELWGIPELDYSCCYIYPNNIGPDLHIMLEENVATRFEILSDRLETVIGIKVGDDEDLALKLPADKLHVEKHQYLGEDGKYILFKTSNECGYLFETHKGVIIEIRSGKITSIQYVEGCL